MDTNPHVGNVINNDEGFVVVYVNQTASGIVSLHTMMASGTRAVEFLGFKCGSTQMQNK